MERLLSLRELLALAVAALIPGIVLSVPALIGGNVRDVIWAFPVVAATALVVALIIGLPAIIVLNWLKLFGLFWYLGVGVVAALALAAYFVLPDMESRNFAEGWPAYAAQLTILLFLSLLVTALYWIAVRPDKIHGA